MFVEALFATVKIEKQPKCPSSTFKILRLRKYEKNSKTCISKLISTIDCPRNDFTNIAIMVKL